ncbi:unnamed protein product [Adineta steineri]|uniref:Uncharacterized protein n=1 Tax=Adineta steineri TaxID=433720 RepID=A0A814K5C3_9BILA|nr:unnamed protein product [Adineta steineri]CAF1054085.1 unnamed protein product [Adineta steineri]CAF1121288.1 unnamed protein product [Adineta steineri]
MASIVNTTSTNSTLTSTYSYPPTVQTGPVGEHDQPYALYGHWGITWLYQLTTDEYAWNDYIKRSTDLVEYGTFQSKNNHEKVATWEEALASRTTLKDTKSKSKNNYKVATDKRQKSQLLVGNMPAIVLLNPEDAGSLLREPKTDEEIHERAYWDKNSFKIIMKEGEYIYKAPDPEPYDDAN